MKYLSLFSGIEAASVAWYPLGWQPVAFAEIEAFPAAVLAHHYPGVPNLGDVLKIADEQIAALGPIDLVVGGSPCQDLSVAGKRAGLIGKRSSLFHEQVRIFHAARTLCGARFLLWENVPGAFSTHSGRDFACVVGALAGCEFGVPPEGWGNHGAAVGSHGLVEWGVLDAQWFGLAQRRKRVFAVLDTGDWRNREPILLISESLRGDPAPSREAGKGVANAVTERPDRGGGNSEGQRLIADNLRSHPRPGSNSLGQIAPCLTQNYGKQPDNSDTNAGPVSPALNTQSGSHHAPDTKAYVVTDGLPEIVGTLSDGAHMWGGLNGQDAYSGRIIPVAGHCVVPPGAGPQGQRQRYEAGTPDSSTDRGRLRCDGIRLQASL